MEREKGGGRGGDGEHKPNCNQSNEQSMSNTANKHLGKLVWQVLLHCMAWHDPASFCTPKTMAHSSALLPIPSLRSSLLGSPTPHDLLSSLVWPSPVPDESRTSQLGVRVQLDKVASGCSRGARPTACPPAQGNVDVAPRFLGLFHSQSRLAASGTGRGLASLCTTS